MFRSFFFAGFECATGYNAQREWFDQIAATQHDRFVEEDYRRLRDAGLDAVREGIRWPCVDLAGHYDLRSVKPFVRAARKYQHEVIWDLFHYGYPDDVNLFSDNFPQRFADYCHAVARFIGSETEGPWYFTPVNEPSFLAWAAGDMGLFAPHCRGRASELKLSLAKAGIAGVNAIRAVLPEARIVNVDPICNVVPPADRADLAAAAAKFNECDVFESLDMLSGKLMPELGGSRQHLDIVGINYYWTNQWELGRNHEPLTDDDPRRLPLREIVRRVWERYGGDVLITETTHVDGMRANWLNYVSTESQALLAEDVALRGVCLYPILGMPEWHARDRWTCLGLWDLENRGGQLHRQVCAPMLEALQAAQAELGECPKPALP